MDLYFQIDYAEMFRELDSILDVKKSDYSAMIFNSVEELKIHNLMMKKERENRNYMGSKGAPEGPESI